MFVEVLVKMKIIVSETGKYFNTDLVGLFQRTIGIYPIGSYVELEDRAVLNLIDHENIYIVRGIPTSAGIEHPQAL